MVIIESRYVKRGQVKVDGNRFSSKSGPVLILGTLLYVCFICFMVEFQNNDRYFYIQRVHT